MSDDHEDPLANVPDADKPAVGAAISQYQAANAGAAVTNVLKYSVAGNAVTMDIVVCSGNMCEMFAGQTFYV